MTDVAIYTDSKLLPPVKDALGALFSGFPDIEVYQWSETMDRTTPVLVLGNLPEILPITYVKTLSQKQIVTNNAAMTELEAALRNLLKPPEFEPMTYEVVTTTEQAAAAFKALGNVVVVDIETGGDISVLTPEEMWLLSCALHDGSNHVYVLSEEWLAQDKHKAMLAVFLLAPKRKLIAHNMKFDFRTLSAQLGVEIRGHLDTMLLHHAINPGGREHGLKQTAKKYLGADDWEKRTKEFVKGSYKDLTAEGYSKLLPEGYRYPQRLLAVYGLKLPVGYEAIPRAILYEYNAYDVYWDWHLYQYLARAAEGEERIARIAKFEFNASNLFQEVEKAGVAVDLDYLHELDVKYTAEKIAVLEKLAEITGDPDFNPNSPPQVKKFYASMGFPMKSTAEGVLEQLKYDESSTEDMRAKLFTETLLEARGITKMKGTYVDGILKRVHGNIVYPDFLVHGTSTGRLSSRDPNIQNIPRDEDAQVSLRRIFVPRGPGRSLVSVDYSQAELRVMAEMSGDEYLISLFQPGMPDFFDSLMPTAFPGVDLDKLDKATKKNMRAKLKGVIYGLSFGRQANAIAKALNMSPREAQTIINNYFKAAPALYDWRMWVTEMALDPERTLVSPFGRYYQAEVVTGRNKQNIVNSGLAFLPQSTASDICVTAAIAVHTWLHEYDAMIVATIHDAILMDVPDEHIEVVAARVQEEMRAAAAKIFFRVPFDTDATWGKSWEGI